MRETLGVSGQDTAAEEKSLSWLRAGEAEVDLKRKRFFDSLALAQNDMFYE